MSNFFTSGYAIPVPRPTTSYNGQEGMTFEQAMRVAEVPSTADLGVVIKRDRTSGKIEMSTNTGIAGGIKVGTSVQSGKVSGVDSPAGATGSGSGMSALVWIGIAILAAKVTRLI